MVKHEKECMEEHLSLVMQSHSELEITVNQIKAGLKFVARNAGVSGDLNGLYLLSEGEESESEASE